VGSVFRTADAFLLEAIYICGYTATPPHKEIRKTALGADESVHFRKFSNANEAIESLRSDGYKVYAVEQAKGSTLLHQLKTDLHHKVAVVFGNEVSGV